MDSSISGPINTRIDELFDVRIIVEALVKPSFVRNAKTALVELGRDPHCTCIEANPCKDALTKLSLVGDGSPLM
jgi:hypothetical protein